MKTNYRFLYLITLLLGIFLISCSEENDPADEDPVDDGSGIVTDDKMYFPPIGSNDWDTQSATTIGWDTTNLNEAIRYAKDNKSTNLLIIYKGRMVVERYWLNTNASTQREINSIAKSMMSLVIGKLQEDGTIKLDAKVSEYLAPGWSLSPETEGDITVRHLLTMSSGLDEELASVGPPGETWRYSHTAYRRLYNVIEAATGRPFKDVFDEMLFSRIGMSNFTWSGKDISTSARELAKFGLAILNKGVWNGDKLLNDEGYFSAMTTTSQSIQEAYGYLWWLNGTDTWYDDDHKTTMDGSIAATMPADGFMAKGFADQRIFVVPSLELVVIRQGNYTSLPEVAEGSFDYEFWQRLMKAIKPAPTGN